MSRIAAQASEEHRLRRRARLVGWLLLVPWLASGAAYWDSVPTLVGHAAFISMVLLAVVWLVLYTKAERIGEAEGSC